MKKVTKICIITAILAAIAGIISLFAGMAMGAKPEQFLQIQIGSGGIRVGQSPGIQFGTDGEKAAGEGRKESLAAGQISRLEMSIASGVVEIYLTEDEEEITCYSNRNRDICKVKDNTLMIKEESRLGIGEDLKLELYLPRKMWKEIDLELGAGSAAIEKLQAEEIAIELGAGEMEIGSLHFTDSADLQVGAGELNVGLCDGKELSLECGIGSMTVILAGRETDYNYRLECGIGTISLQGQAFSGMGRESSVNNQAVKQVQAECGMGEIVIDFADGE